MLQPNLTNTTRNALVTAGHQLFLRCQKDKYNLVLTKQSWSWDTILGPGIRKKSCLRYPIIAYSPKLNVLSVQKSCQQEKQKPTKAQVTDKSGLDTGFQWTLRLKSIAPFIAMQHSSTGRPVELSCVAMNGA